MNSVSIIKLMRPHQSIKNLFIFLALFFAGSAVTDIPLSVWVVAMTFLFALFIVLAKRRNDVLIYLETGKKMRRAIDGYNLQFLDTAMAIMASAVIVAHTIHVTSSEIVQRMHSQYLYFTTFFVILGIMRYRQTAFVYLDSSSPTKIVSKDRFMQLTIVGCIVTFVWILY